MKKFLLVLMTVLAVVAVVPMAVADDGPGGPPEEANSQPYTPDTGDGIQTTHWDDGWGYWVAGYYVAFVLIYTWLYATGWVKVIF